jgi:hypothetical protein
MKKWLPYIIAGTVVMVLVILLAGNTSRNKRFDDRVTLRKEEKIPYGTFVAKQLIPSLFANAEVIVNRYEPDDWASHYDVSNEAVVSISTEFNADEDELFDMLRFAKNGNYVFISSQSISDDAQRFFHLSTSELASLIEGNEASLGLRLEQPPFASDSLYQYPGKKFSGWIYGVDSVRTTVLGRDDSGRPQFVRMDAGKGSIFIHLSPLAFSNYFILHKNNIRYFEQALSVIPKEVNKISWNEYYSSKPADPRNNNQQKQPSFLRVLMKEPAFAWALWTAIFTILLYALMEMRRKQRFIPAYAKPQNDSLDFIKTIGRLYYDRKDHHNLARKMSAYFLEHVRANYKLATHTLDDKFVQSLHHKSGHSVEKITSIVQFINHLENTSTVTEGQLASYHKQLENFYQTT